MILSGKTVTVNFADGRKETVAITNSDELRFEQQQKISLHRVLLDGQSAPLWVVAGIVHWRLLRSDVVDIPQDLDEFIDMLDPDEWLELADVGKAPDSDPGLNTG